MCRNWRRGVSILVLGLLTVATLEATTFAETTIGEKGTVLHELRAAHKLLIEADHDYDGHRLKAAEKVHKAIHDLEGKHASKKVESGTTTLTSTPVIAKTPKGKSQAAAKPRHLRRPVERSSCHLEERAIAISGKPSQSRRQHHGSDRQSPHGASH